MWHEIRDSDELKQFMDNMLSFHDSCIKEMYYLSGAYVTDTLSMYPINDRRVLRIIFQRQYENLSMIELEFCGLKKLKLSPVNESYTCEILDSTLLMKDGNIYWCDCGGLTETDLDAYTGTLVCAAKLRWRAVMGFMGENLFYHSDV